VANSTANDSMSFKKKEEMIYDNRRGPIERSASFKKQKPTSTTASKKKPHSDPLKKGLSWLEQAAVLGAHCRKAQRKVAISDNFLDLRYQAPARQGKIWSRGHQNRAKGVGD